MAIPAFYSGVRFLCETLAGLPAEVCKVGGKVRTPVLHPINTLLNKRINPLTIPYVVKETLYHHAIVWGNGFAYIRRDKTYKTTGIYTLTPDLVMPFRWRPDPTDDNPDPEWSQYYQIGGRENVAVVPAADIIHIPGLGFDGLAGYPVVFLLAETLQLARNAQRYGAKYLQKGTQVRQTIEIPMGATEEQIQQTLALVNKRHGGIDSEYDTAILTGGATMKNNTIPPQQSQLIETIAASVLDICRILRVPPHIVYSGMDGKTATEEQGVDVVKYSLRNWIEKSEEEFSTKLLTPAERDSGLEICFDVSDLQRGQTEVRNASILALKNAGIITTNEARGEMGRAPSADPEADKLHILGDTHPPTAPPPIPPQAIKNSAHAHEAQPPAAVDIFGALRPLLIDAVNRVEAKTESAFKRREGKPDAERTIWANVFSGEQATYTHEALKPIADTLRTLNGPELDVGTIAERYAASIRKRAIDATPTNLTAIIEGMTHADQ